MSAVTIFAAETTSLTFTKKNGTLRSITAEGAIFKGGKELMGQIKDQALESALAKASNGRYRAAFDILSVAFPSVARTAEKLLGNDAWANKLSFALVIKGVLNAAPGSKGYSTKQTQARHLANALTSLPAFADLAPAGEVIEA